MNQRISVVVSLASHVHQTPHTGLAQMLPVTMMSVAKTIPSSAVAKARLSQRSLLVRRCIMLATATTTIDARPIIPNGTWK